MLSHFSCVWHFVTLWTVALQASLSMGFSRQEYWNGMPCPPPGDLPHPGIKPVSLTSPALAGEFFTSTTWEFPNTRIMCIKNGQHGISCPTCSVRTLTLSFQEVGAILLPLNLGGLWLLLQGEKQCDFRGSVVRSDTTAALPCSSAWSGAVGVLRQHVRTLLPLKVLCWRVHREMGTQRAPTVVTPTLLSLPSPDARRWARLCAPAFKHQPRKAIQVCPCGWPKLCWVSSLSRPLY